MRTAPGAARMRGAGERLPWRGERGRILMGRPGVLPPCRLTAASSCFLQLLRSHPGPLLAPRTPLKEPEPPAGGLGAIGRPLAAGPSPPPLPTEKAQARRG